MGKTKKMVNTRARQVIQKARKRGYTHADIAKLCNVSEGSVDRWYVVGRARANRIAPLVNRIGSSYPSAEEVAKEIINIYKKNKQPFRLNNGALMRLSGRKIFKQRFIAELVEKLEERRYYCPQVIDENDQLVHIVVSRKRLLMIASRELTKDEIRAHYGEQIGLEERDDTTP